MASFAFPHHCGVLQKLVNNYPIHLIPTLRQRTSNNSQLIGKSRSTFTSLNYPNHSHAFCKTNIIAEHYNDSSPFYHQAFSSKTTKRNMSSMSSNHNMEYNVQTVDLRSYLSQIEKELTAEGDKFIVPIRRPNQKPMIRTLLGIYDKVEFERLIRCTQKETSYHQMSTFIEEILFPYLQQNPPNCNDVNIHDLYLNYQRTKQSRSDASAIVFSRVATGRKYKGDLLALVQDLTTPEIEVLYLKALEPLRKHQIYNIIIDKYEQTRMVSPDRIEAARKIVHYFQTMNNNNDDEEEDLTEDGDIESDSLSSPIPQNVKGISNKNGNVQSLGKISGKECESACISWLEQRFQSHSSPMTLNNNCDSTSFLLLQNVFVNNTSTSTRPKYSSNFFNSSSRFSKVGMENKFSSGIIWTNSSRDKVCSEFDAAIVSCSTVLTTTTNTCSHDDGIQPQQQSCNDRYKSQIREIWEAKYSLSPSSVYDAIIKKLPAIRSILQDDGARLTYGGNEYDLENNTSNDETTSRHEDYNHHFESSHLIFGIFGMDLLPPMNAIGQLRSIAVSNLLSSDVDAVLNAVDSGFVLKIDVALARRDLDLLRKEIDSIRDFRIQIKVLMS